MGKRKKDDGTAAMDNTKIDKIINKYKGKPNAVIHVLMEIQSQNHWLPREILAKVSTKLEVPLNEVLHIVTFYKTFSLIPQGRHGIHVCTGSSCHVRGAQRVLERVQEVTGIKPGETSPDLRFSLEIGNCLGCCSLGPEIVVDGEHHSNIAPDDIEDVLKNYK